MFRAARRLSAGDLADVLQAVRAKVAGRRMTRLGGRPGVPFLQQTGPDCAAADGFSLHAGVCVPGGPRERERLEHLCRYVARPALATERLSELPDGRIAYDLRRPWSDGTSRIVLEPLAFMERLAALVPPPRAHLVTDHGVLAPAAALCRDSGSAAPLSPGHSAVGA